MGKISVGDKLFREQEKNKTAMKESWSFRLKDCLGVDAMA